MKQLLSPRKMSEYRGVLDQLEQFHAQEVVNRLLALRCDSCKHFRHNVVSSNADYLAYVPRCANEQRNLYRVLIGPLGKGEVSTSTPACGYYEDRWYVPGNDE